MIRRHYRLPAVFVDDEYWGPKYLVDVTGWGVTSDDREESGTYDCYYDATQEKHDALRAYDDVIALHAS